MLLREQILQDIEQFSDLYFFCRIRPRRTTVGWQWRRCSSSSVCRSWARTPLSYSPPSESPSQVGGEGCQDTSTCACALGWVSTYMYVSNFRMFNVFIIRQAYLRLKVPKQANFCRSFQNSRAEIELCANLLAMHCDNTIQDKRAKFCIKASYVQVLKNKTSQYRYPLKTYLLFLNLNTSKILYFVFFCKCVKNTWRNTKNQMQRSDMKSALSN